MDAYIQSYIALVDGVKISSLFGLVGLDFLLGVILAVFSKSFDWHKLANFVDSNILKLVAGYLLVGVFALLEPSAQAAVWATWAVIDAKLIADIITKLKQLGVALKK